MTVRQPVCFVGHGIPSVLAEASDPTHAWLRRFGASLRATSPRGIVCVSAHFVASAFCVTTAEAPDLLHDDESADVSRADYHPRGSAALARRVIEHLLHARLKATADATRGLDHGAWLPLSLMFPEGDLPIVQVSLHASGDAELHFALGRALEPLRDEDILIVGSGGVTQVVVEAEERGRRFSSWVADLLTKSPPYARARGLTRFRDHPDAHAVIGPGEHFLPLIVVAGAASKDNGPGNVGVQVHAGWQRGLSMAAFSFER